MHVMTEKELRYKNDKNSTQKTVHNDKEKQINMPDRTKITEETTMTRMTKMSMVTGITRLLAWGG